jgi:hypothetical protein
LQQLAAAASDQLPVLRRCYREVASKRPTAAGSIAVRITLAPGARAPTLEVKEKSGTDPEVTRCVTHTLEHTSWRKVERPAAAVLSLEFENSRAKGEHEMAERRQVAEQVELRPHAGGGFEASWATKEGTVAFAVSSTGAREGVELVLRKLRDSFAGFADCRRRSEQGGRSPAGSVEARLELQPHKRGHAKVLSSSVAHPRAAPCVEQSLGGLHFDEAVSDQAVDVQITFGG